MTQRPILLGIVGDSAAGKTTITKGLTQLLGPERVSHVCTDDYHKYDRQERARLNITPLHPDCNYLDILELHLERAHYGQSMLKPVYDHSTGSLVRPEYVEPREFVIVEGLHGFHSATLRQFYDVKVYLDPPEDLRYVWKIKRDTTKRGYTAEQVRAEMARRESDSREFIRPQREFADIVVQFSPDPGVPPEAGRWVPERQARLASHDSPSRSELPDRQHSRYGGRRAHATGPRLRPPSGLSRRGRRRYARTIHQVGRGDLATLARPASAAC